MAPPDRRYLDSVTEGQYAGELPGNQRSFKMQNMSLQTIGLLDASLPLALPPASAASYRNTRGEKPCPPGLGDDRAQRKEAMSSGAVDSVSRGVGQIQTTSPKSREKVLYLSPASTTEDGLPSAQHPAASL